MDKSKLYNSPIDLVPMPELMVETVDDNGIDNLRIAIVKAAADAYVDLVKSYLRDPSEEQTLDKYVYHEERFFRGTWFKTLTLNKISGAYMIKALRAKAQKEVSQ